MQIDWFTLIAQVVNFLILVIILRKLLYKRIINTMDEREARIAKRISDAEETKAKAEEIERDYTEKRDEIQRQKESIIAEAKEDAKERADKIMSDAREDVEAKKEKWLENLRKDKENFVKRLNKEATERVIATAEKALTELADEGLNTRIIEKFAIRLKELTESEIEEFKSALESEESRMSIITAFELDDSAKNSLVETAQERFGKVSATWEIESGKIAGVELRAGGKKLEWSIEEYIGELREAIRVAFDEMTEERKEKSKDDDE